MRIFLCFLLYLAVPVSAAARPADTPVVEVFIPPVPGTSMNMAFLRARSVVSEAYSEIGVIIRWRHPVWETSGCSNRAPHPVIVVAFSWQTPLTRHPGALAFSNPYFIAGACITVFMDRLQSMMAPNPNTTGILLGYVVAHELGHVLQGIARHSETGILKERWSPTEVTDMPFHRLHFTPYDTELILGNIRAGGK